MKKIFLILLVSIFLFSSKLKIIDTHKAWETYPSTSGGNEKYKIEFPSKKDLKKLNANNINQIKREKTNYLYKLAQEKLNKTNSINTYNIIGIIYAQNYFYEKALYYFKQALKFEKTSETYNNIANVYYIIRNDNLATKYYKLALKCQKNNPITLLNLAFIYYENCDFKNAKKCYLTSIIIDPLLDRPEYNCLANENVNNETKENNKGVKGISFKWQY